MYLNTVHIIDIENINNCLLNQELIRLRKNGEKREVKVESNDKR